MLEERMGGYQLLAVPRALTSNIYVGMQYSPQLISICVLSILDYVCTLIGGL